LDDAGGHERAGMVAHRPQQVGGCARQAGGLEIFAQYFGILLHYLKGNVGIFCRECVGQRLNKLQGEIGFTFLGPQRKGYVTGRDLRPLLAGCQ
jgi:hypothetical protein